MVLLFEQLLIFSLFTLRAALSRLFFCALMLAPALRRQDDSRQPAYISVAINPFLRNGLRGSAIGIILKSESDVELSTS